MRPARACGGPTRAAAAPAPPRPRPSAGRDRARSPPRGTRGRAGTARGTSNTESRWLLRFLREDDQARRVGAERRLVEVAPDGRDAQARPVQQRDELVRRVGADALAERLGRSGAANLDLLLEPGRRGIPRPADAVLLVAARAAFVGDEAREDVVAPERVAEEGAARSEYALDLVDDSGVLGLRPQVAEAREEVDDGAEGGDAQGKRAHVAAHEQGVPVAPAGEVEQRRGVVEADRRRAGLGERDRVPPGAAAQVEERPGVRRQVRQGEGGFPARGGEVAVGVEVEVLLAEPGFPPRHTGAKCTSVNTDLSPLAREGEQGSARGFPSPQRAPAAARGRASRSERPAG